MNDSKIPVIRVPKELKSYAYDKTDPKTLIVQINNHLTLIKACLSMPFTAECFYTRTANKFEYMSHNGQSLLALTGTGEIYAEQLELQTSEYNTLKYEGRSFYLPIKV